MTVSVWRCTACGEEFATAVGQGPPMHGCVSTATADWQRADIQQAPPWEPEPYEPSPGVTKPVSKVTPAEKSDMFDD